MEKTLTCIADSVTCNLTLEKLGIPGNEYVFFKNRGNQISGELAKSEKYTQQRFDAINNNTEGTNRNFMYLSNF